MLTVEEFGTALDEASRHLQSGEGLEALLIQLRNKGADKIDSIRVLKSVMGVSTPQAKSLVDRSITWSDRYAQDQAFHQMLMESATKISCESPDLEVTVDERSPHPRIEYEK